MPSVVPRIVNNVSYVTRISHDSHFAWQAQYLVMLSCHFSWQAHHSVKFGMIAGARNVVFFPKAAAKGSFEKSVAIKDCHQSSAEVMAVFKDCNQTLPKVLLE